MAKNVLILMGSPRKKGDTSILCDEFKRGAIHNLVTDPDVRGIGDVILSEVEKFAVRLGKDYLRLDCAVDNEFLNRYYEKHDYKLAGRCSEGLYIGNRREKKLK